MRIRNKINIEIGDQQFGFQKNMWHEGSHDLYEDETEKNMDVKKGHICLLHRLHWGFDNVRHEQLNAWNRLILRVKASKW